MPPNCWQRPQIFNRSTSWQRSSRPEFIARRCSLQALASPTRNLLAEDLLAPSGNKPSMGKVLIIDSSLAVANRIDIPMKHPPGQEAFKSRLAAANEIL